MSTAITGPPDLDAVGEVAVVVAHPDDETLWAGGLLLSHPAWSVFVVSLCRGHDADRAPRFARALQRLGAQGRMADLDDGPEQTPLADELLDETIQAMLPPRVFDAVLTHGPAGEYTRHRRHEEVARAVDRLWQAGRLRAGQLWQFAYQDDGGASWPSARTDARWRFDLSDRVWAQKYAIITGIYGFAAESWEARVVPRTEGFDGWRGADGNG